MKKFTQLTLAATLGGGLAFALGQWYQQSHEGVTISHVPGAPVSSVLYSGGQPGEGAATPIDFTLAASKATPAVVYVESGKVSDVDRSGGVYDFFYGPSAPRGRRGLEIGSGSGVIINEKGYIVTNYHVVKDASRVKVTLSDKSAFDAEVVGMDPDTDVALIKIDKEDLPYLSFVDSDKTKVGQWVLAVGNPFNLLSTVTAGIISAKGRDINLIGRDEAEWEGGAWSRTQIEAFIQTDAAINPGNSGGALVDLNGGLVGINTGISSPTGAYSGYGFAVPSNIVSKVVEDLIAYGAVQRGWLGVTVQNVDAELAKNEDLQETEGAYVTGFADHSSAKEAGVKKGDVIVKLDDMEVKSNVNLIEYIGTRRPGDKIAVTVDRSGKRITLSVTLKNKQGSIATVKAAEVEGASAGLGLGLEALNAGQLKQLGLKSGVRVSSLSRGKILSGTDMKPGFIITHVDNKEVSSAKQIQSILETKKKGDLVVFAGLYEDFHREYIYALRM